MTSLTIDGRSGGGQLMRTALSLSALTATPFEIEHIRATRPTPGLKPQHLAAVRAVAALCDADVEGASVDSEALAFQPTTLSSTPLDIDIGTAGSVTLLFDAVLPLAARIEDGLDLSATGGTDVKWAPTIDYYRRVKLPLLGWFGLDAAVELERTGFYPTGGGRARLTVEPSALAPVELADRGSLERVQVYSKASEELADAEVSDRQAGRAHDRLHEASFHADIETVDYVDSPSPGSSLLLRAVYEHSLAGFDTLGERGKPSEAVADEAVERFLAFADGPGAVDEHLADQVLVFVALAGGRVRVPRLTDHIRSNAELIGRFGYDLDLAERPDGSVVVEARPAARGDRSVPGPE